MTDTGEWGGGERWLMEMPPYVAYCFAFIRVSDIVTWSSGGKGNIQGTKPIIRIFSGGEWMSFPSNFGGYPLDGVLVLVSDHLPDQDEPMADHPTL